MLWRRSSCGALETRGNSLDGNVHMLAMEMEEASSVMIEAMNLVLVSASVAPAKYSMTKCP